MAWARGSPGSHRVVTMPARPSTRSRRSSSSAQNRRAISSWGSVGRRSAVSTMRAATRRPRRRRSTSASTTWTACSGVTATSAASVGSSRNGSQARERLAPDAERAARSLSSSVYAARSPPCAVIQLVLPPNVTRPTRSCARKWAWPRAQAARAARGSQGARSSMSSAAVSRSRTTSPVRSGCRALTSRPCSVSGRRALARQLTSLNRSPGTRGRARRSPATAAGGLACVRGRPRRRVEERAQAAGVEAARGPWRRAARSMSGARAERTVGVDGRGVGGHPAPVAAGHVHSDGRRSARRQRPCGVPGAVTGDLDRPGHVGDDVEPACGRATATCTSSVSGSPASACSGSRRALLRVSVAGR